MTGIKCQHFQNWATNVTIYVCPIPLNSEVKTARIETNFALLKTVSRDQVSRRRTWKETIGCPRTLLTEIHNSFLSGDMWICRQDFYFILFFDHYSGHFKKTSYYNLFWTLKFEAALGLRMSLFQLLFSLLELRIVSFRAGRSVA